MPLFLTDKPILSLISLNNFQKGHFYPQSTFACSKLTIETLEHERCKICSKLTIKTPERRQWRRSGGFIVYC